jgi:hypothetical protein
LGTKKPDIPPLFYANIHAKIGCLELKAGRVVSVHPSSGQGRVQLASAIAVEKHTMKNCKLCRFSKVCNDLPGICILIQYAAVAVLVVSLGYLFLSQEIMS